MLKPDAINMEGNVFFLHPAFVMQRRELQAIWELVSSPLPKRSCMPSAVMRKNSLRNLIPEACSTSGNPSRDLDLIFQGPFLRSAFLLRTC